MNIKSLIGSARSLCGGSPPITLKADKSTDQPPMELFITDEHTEHYLSFKSGDESARGEITGMIFLMCTIPGLTVAALSIFSGNVDNIIFPLLIGGAILPISFIWECRAKLPLPVIFNRRTREVYFDHEGELFHTPWDDIEAITYEFMVIGPYVGGLNNAALEILVRRLGEPESALMVPLGAPMGKNLNMQKSFWEYIRSYMNNGPWFDEHGNNSPSKNFIQGQLSNDTKPSNLLTHQIKSTFKNKPADGKKNRYKPHKYYSFSWVFFSPPHTPYTRLYLRRSQTPSPQPLARNCIRASAPRWPNHPID